MRLTIYICAVLLAGCATTAVPSYSDIAAQYPEIEQPERINASIDVDCPLDAEPCWQANDCVCDVLYTDIVAAGRITQALQDSIEHRVDAYNHLLRSLTSCEYRTVQQSAAISAMERQGHISSIVSAGKQIVLAGVCGILLSQ